MGISQWVGYCECASAIILGRRGVINGLQGGTWLQLNVVEAGDGDLVVVAVLAVYGTRSGRLWS